MPWVRYQPRSSFRSKTLEKDEATLYRSGLLLVHREALATLGVDGRVVVLVDQGSERIALRKPEPDEVGDALNIREDKGAESRGAMAIGLVGALKSAGWKVGSDATFAGTCKAVFREADKMVIIKLEDIRTG